MMGGNTPILVLREGTRREKGKGAQSSNIAAAKAVADAVRSTLGPRGMDKMLVDSMGDVVITNDGVTILKEMDIEHPAAKMLVEVAKTQDEECGDGTTTAVVMAGELLKKAEELIEQNVHSTVISAGYRMASEKAVEILKQIGNPISITNAKELKKVGMTAMISKSVSSDREYLADIAVKAVTATVEKQGDRYVFDKDNIQMVKKQGGTVRDTNLIEGLILDKEVVHSGMPKTISKARIALVDAAMEVKKTEIDAKIEINDPGQLQAFLSEEERMLKTMANTVKASGANVLVCQKGIDDLAQHYLAKDGIYAVRRAKKSDMEKLSKATGASIVSKWNDLSKDDLGTAEIVEERKIGDDKMTFVTGCKGAKAVSILMRGGTEHVVDEIERSLTDAISTVGIAIEDGLTVTGAGSAAVEISMRLRDFATTIGGREQIAIEAYAEALEIVPRTLAENAGMDPIDSILELRKQHKEGKVTAGVNVLEQKISDMKATVVEPLRVGKQAILSATDAACMILRIDDVIASKSGGGPGGPKKGGPGGGEDSDFD
jgi:thermosome